MPQACRILWALWVLRFAVYIDKHFGQTAVQSPTNVLGGRVGQGMVLDASRRQLLIFGGVDQALTYRDQMWSYDLQSRLWTWLSGSTASNLAPTFGTIGVAVRNEVCQLAAHDLVQAAGNTPGGRARFGIVLDPQSALVWVFGGTTSCCASGTTTWLNDLWSLSTCFCFKNTCSFRSWNKTSGWWTWRAGSTLKDAAGNYGTIGIAVLPDVRFLYRVSVAEYHELTLGSHGSRDGLR